MNYKKEERAETEIVDYRRIFCGDFEDKPDGGGNNGKDKAGAAALKKAREKRFVTVFLAQAAICLTVLSAALVLKYTKPDTFETVSSVLSGFYENNITLSDLNQMINERISNNDALAAFFNFSPAQDSPAQD